MIPVEKLDYTQGDPDVCIARVGMTTHREITGGVWRAEAGENYKRRDWPDPDALNQYLGSLYKVSLVEGYLSAKGVVTYLDYEADYHQQLWNAYNRWLATEQPKIAKVSTDLAEREADRVFGRGVRGKWWQPDSIRAGDINLEVTLIADGAVLTREQLMSLVAGVRSGVRR